MKRLIFAATVAILLSGCSALDIAVVTGDAIHTLVKEANK